MIRTYTVTEVEQICGVSRRTISEYVAKGLLSGPSHRGRGARYPQSDVDVLQVVPRFRTLMKREFPNLNSLAEFLRQISIRDLNMLARLSNESSFVLGVRRLRVRNNLASLAPHVPPERIEKMLNTLTPGQIRAVDSGRYQIGAALDLGALLQDRSPGRLDEFSDQAAFADANESQSPATTATNPDLTTQPSWSVSWVDGGLSDSAARSALAPEDIGSLTDVIARIEQKAAATAARLSSAAGINGASLRHTTDFDDTQRDLMALANNSNAANTTVAAVNLGQRLSDISLRLERLEAILEHE